MTKYIVLVLLATSWTHSFGDQTDDIIRNEETDSSSATVHIAASNLHFPEENGRKAMSGTSFTVE